MRAPTRTPTAEALTVFADELRGLCAVITKIARRDHQHLLDRHQTGLSALEHGVLRRAAHGARTLGEVSELMATAPSTLVYVIDRLVAKGLLTKRNDPSDRRREHLSLTRRGRSLLVEIPTMDTDSAIVRSLAGMNQKQRAGLRRYLTAFVAGLEGASEWRPEFRPVTRARAKPKGERGLHR